MNKIVPLPRRSKRRDLDALIIAMEVAVENVADVIGLTYCEWRLGNFLEGLKQRAREETNQWPR